MDSNANRSRQYPGFLFISSINRRTVPGGDLLPCSHAFTDCGETPRIFCEDRLAHAERIANLDDASNRNRRQFELFRWDGSDRVLPLHRFEPTRLRRGDERFETRDELFGDGGAGRFLFRRHESVSKAILNSRSNRPRERFASGGKSLISRLVNAVPRMINPNSPITA